MAEDAAAAARASFPLGTMPRDVSRYRVALAMGRVRDCRPTRE
jgi:hypothetical protein